MVSFKEKEEDKPARSPVKAVYEAEKILQAEPDVEVVCLVRLQPLRNKDGGVIFAEAVHIDAALRHSSTDEEDDKVIAHVLAQAYDMVLDSRNTRVHDDERTDHGATPSEN